MTHERDVVSNCPNTCILIQKSTNTVVKVCVHSSYINIKLHSAL